MNKKGQVTLYITFIIFAVIILLIAAVLAPMGVRINSEFYEIGEEMMLDANDTIAEINDTEARTRIQGIWNESFAAQENNIEINANFFQYSWIIVVGLTSLVIFLVVLRIKEFGQGGFI